MSTIARHSLGIGMVLVLALLAPARAEIRTSGFFANHMVLQQGKPLPVWGWAEAGKTITVTLAGKTGSAVAGADGKWMVTLAALPVGGPHELSISGDGDKVFKDVMVGEVWICSGQSNMAWRASQANNAEAEAAAADYPGIRMFTMPSRPALEPQDECGGNWRVCTPQSVGGFSAVGYFFARKLHQDLGVPIGMLHTSWGGTPAQAWTPKESLLAEESLAHYPKQVEGYIENYPKMLEKYEKDLAEWPAQAEAAKAAGKPEPRKPRKPNEADRNPSLGANLYNGMVQPLVPYAIAGAIWYQGESNAGRAFEYRTLFPAMIRAWRAKFGQGDFPFLFVQLANYRARADQPGPSDWAELREAQTMTLSLPNTGMAVIIDIGEEKDIHPRNKQDVGLRLALGALRIAYGKDIVFSGPMYDSMKVGDDGSVVLTFKHAAGLKTSDGGPVKGFAVAGEDQKFVWADAEIKGELVVVKSAGIAKPVAVRYAWANNPECNLVNGAGLPASPFRTDNWPGVTDKNR